MVRVMVTVVRRVRVKGRETERESEGDEGEGEGNGDGGGGAIAPSLANGTLHVAVKSVCVGRDCVHDITEDLHTT